MNQTWHAQAHGLTGIIGSGKSTAAEIFRELGAFTASADDFARLAVAPGTEAFEAIRKTFGRDIIDSSGDIDRNKLGGIIFDDLEKKTQLESITHPAIRKLAAQTFEDAFKQNYPLYIYECPLLFEVGIENYSFKHIILVTANRETCLERIMARDGVSHEEAVARHSNQLPLAEKKKLADIVIDNSGSIEELRSEIVDVFEKLSK